MQPTENFNNRYVLDTMVRRLFRLTLKNVIYFFVFVFIHVGVFGITAWATLSQVDAPLSFAVTTFLWGITLAILYVAFEKAGWDWWESYNSSKAAATISGKAIVASQITVTVFSLDLTLLQLMASSKDAPLKPPGSGLSIVI